MYRVTRPDGPLTVAIDLGHADGPKYVSEHFVHKVKPLVRLPKVREGSDLKKLRAYIKNKLYADAGSLPHFATLAYLRSVLAGETERLTDVWESFGVLIGSEGDGISAMNLLKVEDREETEGTIPSIDDPLDSDWDTVLVTAIFELYRVARASNAGHDDYTTKVMSKLGDRLKSMKSDQPTPHQSAIDSLKDNNDFHMVLAATDMFLNKFRKNVLSNCRFGTIISRDQDNAISAELHLLQETTGLSLYAVQTWIYSAAVADDFSRIMKIGEELNKSDSYARYLSDMHLTPKSPYSISSNPAMHLFCMITLALLGSTLDSIRKKTSSESRTTPPYSHML